MRLLAVKLGDFLDERDCAIHAHSREALALELREEILVPPLLALHDRRVDDGLALLFEKRVHNLLRALAANRSPALRAVRHRRGAVEKPQVIVDLRHRGHDGARIAARGALLNGNRRAQALNLIHLGLGEAVEELPSVCA